MPLKKYAKYKNLLPKTKVDKKQNKRIAKIERLVKAERKFYSQTATSSTFSNAGSVFSLTDGLAVGSSIITRVGQNVMVDRIRVTGVVENEIVDVYNVMVLCIFIDTQPNSAPTMCGSGADSALIDFNSGFSSDGFPSLITNKRFRILKWRRVICQNITATQVQAKTFSFNVKLKRPLRVQYNTANNNTLKNNIYFGVVSDSTALTAHPGIQASYRIEYLDV